MDKELLKKLLIGFVVGAIVGSVIRYYRGVDIAPFIGGLAGALFMHGLNKRKKE